MFFKNFHIVKYQLLTALFLNIGNFAIGTNIGWLTTALPLLMSENGPLRNDRISSDMAGWFGSFLSFGALFGCVIHSYISKYIGHKRTLLLGVIPIIFAWLFIEFGTMPLHICLSRFCCGFSWGGGLTLYPQFISEIASEFIRGELNSYLPTSGFLGILVSFIGGSYLPYKTLPLIMLIFPLLFLCSFVFVPDSPQFLLRTNRIGLAEKSLRFYRNCPRGNKENSATFEEEFKKFIAISAHRETTESVRFSEIVSPVALRALFITPFLSAVGLFSGSFSIVSYAVSMFEQTGKKQNSNVSAIIMCLVHVLGTYIASQLIDRIGRKTLLLISMPCGFVVVLITGTFAYLVKHGYDMDSFSAVPVISISAYVFICAIGIVPVPFVIISEVLPRRIRSIGTAFHSFIYFTMQFVILKIFPTILITLEVDGTMLLFACVLIVGCIFTIFVVPETKGVNLDALEVDNNMESPVRISGQLDPFLELKEDH